jgi:hypothetical protein
MVYLPVTCPNMACRSTRNVVYKTAVDKTRLTIERHRWCRACNREWVTVCALPIERFLRNKPSLRRNKVAV